MPKSRKSSHGLPSPFGSRFLSILTAAFCALAPAAWSDSVPEILHYKFEGTGTNVPNLASTPPLGAENATIMGSITQTGADLNSANNGFSLLGNGNASNTDYLNTGWAPNLATGAPWTISFVTADFGSTALLWYIFGDANSNSFRCFTNGVAGPNNWWLRGGGLVDVPVPGGAAPGVHRTTFVYDPVAGNVKVYLDGALVNTVAQPNPVTITGAGPFKVGGYANNSGIAPGASLDDFRFYNRALTEAEVLDIDVAAPLIPLVDDAATSTGGPTRVYPLANDPGAGAGTVISSVDGVVGATIAADGRSVLLPAGYTGTFSYSTSGTVAGTADVVVTAGTPAVGARVFTGLFYDSTGAIAGWGQLALSPKGSGSVSINAGPLGKGKGKFAFPVADTTATSTTDLGNVTYTKNADGTVGVVVAATGGDLTASLRPSVLSTTAAKHHVALAGIDPALPGGAYAIANVKASGTVVVGGVLPDGRPFRAGGYLSDNGVISFYALSTRFVIPPAVVAGEFVSADLPATDVTGEIKWTKPTQGPGAKGFYLGGVNTVLTANGSIYNGVVPISGSSTLILSGGDLLATENATVNVAAGIPEVTGSLKSWGGVKASVGQFRAKVLLPGVARAVSGGGVYLPKSNSAWGFFPGTTQGGTIQLIGP